MGDALLALAMGVALGAATGIPIGVVNVAVVEAAVRAGRRHAVGVGLGGALADAVHAAIAFAGAAPLLAREPALLRTFTIVSAVVIVVYAVRVWRARTGMADAIPGAPRSLTSGVALGAVLTLPNPAPLLAWVAVAASVLPSASIPVGLAGAAGVGVGSAAWFALLAELAHRRALRGRAARWLPPVVAILLIALAAFSAVRVMLD